MGESDYNSNGNKNRNREIAETVEQTEDEKPLIRKVISFSKLLGDYRNYFSCNFIEVL